MSDATPGTASGEGLDDASRDALVQLSIRGMIRGSSTPELQALCDSGLAMAKGPLFMPTPDGTALVQKLTRLPEGGEQEQQVRKYFDAFLPINRRLRDLCTAWQVRPDGSENDHKDPAYDASVRDELDDVHGSISRIIRRMAEHVPQLAHYTEDLAAALDRLDSGDMSQL